MAITMRRAVPITLHEPERRPATTAITDEETGAMLRAYFSLADRWSLSDVESRILLGQPASRTYARWKSGTADLSRIPHDTRQRLSMLMGIHKGLRYMFREPERGCAWMRKPNKAFAGQSTLERMLSGEIVDLAAVRSYLDAEVGGW
jgi:hypothetical protein